VAADEHPPGQRSRPSRRTLTLVGIPIVGLIILSNVGDALAPDLVNSHPLRLLAMNARNRNLILVTNNLDAPSYYIVGTMRLLLADPLFFLLGRWYGDTAIRWMEARTKTFGQLMRQMEGWFSKAAYPVVFFAPNQYICLFAGAAGMSVAGFLLTNISGTIVRLYLIRRLGETFEAPIDDVLGFIRDYRGPLLVVTVVMFAVMMINEVRGSTSGLEELADAVDPEDAPRAEGDDGRDAPAAGAPADEPAEPPGGREPGP
jgi:membrane protein DedA with SNARE-associated domain